MLPPYCAGGIMSCTFPREPMKDGTISNPRRYCKSQESQTGRKTGYFLRRRRTRFRLSPSAIRYAEEAMKKGQTHYTPGTGIPELREAVCAYYKDHFGLEYSPQTLLSGRGAKPLLRGSGMCHRSRRRGFGVHPRMGELRGADTLFRRESGSRGHEQNRIHPPVR